MKRYCRPSVTTEIYSLVHYHNQTKGKGKGKGYISVQYNNNNNWALHTDAKNFINRMQRRNIHNLQSMNSWQQSAYCGQSSNQPA